MRYRIGQVNAVLLQEIVYRGNERFRVPIIGSNGCLDSQLALCLTVAKVIVQINEKPDMQKTIAPDQ